MSKGSMSQSELYHQAANELGIALGMVQLARQKPEDEKKTESYLARAESALVRLKETLKSIQESETDSSKEG